MPLAADLFKAHFKLKISTEATTIASATSAFLAEYGVLMARCGKLEASVCHPDEPDHRRGMFGIFAQGLDVCVSESPERCQYRVSEG